MEPILDSNYDSPSPTIRPKNSAKSRGKAAKSPQKSKRFSGSDQAPDDTRPAGWTPAGSEVGLSILQAGFDQALDEGLTAKLGHLLSSGELPNRILIEVWGAAICPDPECQAWTTQAMCPACGNQIG
jgi:hypothetical protein